MTMATELEDVPPRYRRVAERIAKGWTYPEIGHDLGLTVKTVETYAAELAGQIEGDHLEEYRPKEKIMTWWLVDVSGGSG